MKDKKIEDRKQKTEGRAYKTVDILGVRVDCVDFAQTLNQIETWIREANEQIVSVIDQPIVSNHPPSTKSVPSTRSSL